MKRALNKGLGQLLEETENSYYSGEREDSIMELSVDSIKPNPYQPRKTFNKKALEELAQSIKENGLISPIVVYREGSNYILIAGERRLKALKLNKINKIKSIVVDESEKDKVKVAIWAIVENEQRAGLNPIELAMSYKVLIEDLNIKQEELSHRLSQSRSSISNVMRLLKLSKKVQDMIVEGKLSAGSARVLVGLNKNSQELIAKKIVSESLSTREVEKLVAIMKEPKKIDKKDNFIKLDKRLTEKLKNEFMSLSMDMRMKDNNIIIKIKSDDDLKKILNKLI